MAVRIRMKRMGRTHRPFFRVCAVDGRAPRDGRVIEELGTYDPMLKEIDARAQLKGERIDYWLGVGAQPSENVAVLIKKYGTNGTHLAKQAEALDRLKIKPQAPPPQVIEVAKPEEPAAEAPAEEAAAEGAPAEEASAEAAEGAAEAAPAESTEEKPAEGGE